MTTSKPTEIREQNDVSKQTKIEDAISQLKQSYNNSTVVVGWYYHPCEVRGPFNRWLTVSDVPETHKKDVASQSDDAKYAADAMNFAPKIIADYEQLKAENLKIKARLLDFEGRTYSENQQLETFNMQVEVNRKLSAENNKLKAEVRQNLIDGQEPDEKCQEATHYNWLDDQNDKLESENEILRWQVKDYEEALKEYSELGTLKNRNTTTYLAAITAVI